MLWALAATANQRREIIAAYCDCCLFPVEYSRHQCVIAGAATLIVVMLSPSVRRSQNVDTTLRANKSQRRRHDDQSCRFECMPSHASYNTQPTTNVYQNGYTINPRTSKAMQSQHDWGIAIRAPTASTTPLLTTRLEAKLSSREAMDLDTDRGFHLLFLAVHRQRACFLEVSP
jgi:hypothetical protein